MKTDSEAMPATPDPRAELRAVCEGDRDLGRTKSLLENHDVLDVLDALTAKDEELRSLREERDKSVCNWRSTQKEVEHIGKVRDEFKAMWQKERARADTAEADATRNLLQGTVKGFKAGENADAKHWRERAEKAEAELRSLREASAGAQEKYHELLFAVARKHPNESRHETALRYIREREENVSGPKRALPSPPGAPAATSPSEEDAGL